MFNKGNKTRERLNFELFMTVFTTHYNTIQPCCLGISSVLLHCSWTWMLWVCVFSWITSLDHKSASWVSRDLHFLARMTFWFTVTFSLGKNLFWLDMRLFVGYITSLVHCFQTSSVASQPNSVGFGCLECHRSSLQRQMGFQCDLPADFQKSLFLCILTQHRNSETILTMFKCSF